ncbi:MAG: dienelactone hydrolase family protein [Acidobacteria bacterium]|nr:dienelactone hydrolase family protein [Acidobacteriota bacterium]
MKFSPGMQAESAILPVSRSRGQLEESCGGGLSQVQFAPQAVWRGQAAVRWLSSFKRDTLETTREKTTVEVVTKRIRTAEGVEGYLAYPQGQRSPGILVHFEIFGVNSHIEEVCRRIAGQGYAALAPDYYWRLEKRTAPYTDFNAAAALASTLTDQQVIADAGSALRYFRSQEFVEPEALATAGFCMGGRISILVAAAYPREITAAVSFYGGGLAGENRRPWQTLNPMEEVAPVQAPILLFYGEEDAHILPEHAQQFTARLRELGKNFQHHVYSGAGHGFFCNERDSYHPEAARDAWQKLRDFLEKNLKRTEDAGR